MKKVAASMMVLAFCSTSALAGVVQFNPMNDDVPFGGGISTFAVTLVATDFADFLGADVVIGSNDGLVVSGFEYSPEWLAAVALTPAPPQIGLGIYGSDVFGTGFLSSAAPSLLFGTLTLDSTGLDPGVYDFGVDAGIDGFSGLSGNAGNESLAGAGTVTVVPEPATLSLLGIAAFGMIRRRRRNA